LVEFGNAQPPAPNAVSIVTPVDNNGEPGRYNSLALGSSGYPVISHWDQSSVDLKLAVCNNAACTNPTLTRVGTGEIGEHSSLALNLGK